MSIFAAMLTSTNRISDETVCELVKEYYSIQSKKPTYLIITTNDIESDLQPKQYKIYFCYDDGKAFCRVPAQFKSFACSKAKTLLPEIDKLHDLIINGKPNVRIVKEVGEYDKWYEAAKNEIEKQTQLIVKIKNVDKEEMKKKKHIAELKNMLKPSKEKKNIKQIKTMSNSLKEISVIYINSNDYDKQLNKVKELINNKEDSIDIVQYNGRGWMGAHHGIKICWLKDFVDYMDFNTFISFIDPYRREFSNDGSHFMNDYSLFIINSFIPFNKLFGSLINEEQRTLLNKRVITKFDLDK